MRLARYAPVTLVARIAEREQMMRKVPVRADVRQAVGGSRVRRIPAVRRRECPRCPDRASRARTSADRCAERAPCRASRRRQTVAVGAGHEQAVVVHPANDVRRRRRDRARPSRARPSCWRIFAGTRSVSARNALLKPEVPRERLEERGRRPVAMTTRSARIVPPAVVTSTDRRPNVIRFAGERFEHPRAALGGRRGKAERSPIRIDRRAVAAAKARGANDPDFGLDRAGVEQRRVEPASRRAFCSRLRRALCSASSRPATSRGARSRISVQPPEQRAKSRAARRQACQARRAARSPSAFSTSTKLTPGSSAIHPAADPVLPRPICSASTSTTFTPAAAHAYAVAQPVRPPPTMTTSASR